MGLPRRIGIQTIGAIPISMDGGNVVGGIPAFDFDFAALTFTQRMAVRTGPNGTFAGAPIIQGVLAGMGASDIVSFSRGNLMGNPAQLWYEQVDQYKGAIVFWITPEWDGNDGIGRYVYDSGTGSNVQVLKDIFNFLYLYVGDQSVAVNIATWTAGTSYLVIGRWDTENTLDGTNYLCLTVNATDTFGGTTQPTLATPAADEYIGSEGMYAIDANIEGLTIYRRALYSNDGSGVAATFDASGPIDELAAIYAAGAGVDPCTITGSWDVVFCLPTDSDVPSQLATTGEAWSHPHSSSLINQDLSYPWDGGYLGGNWMVYFDGDNDEVDFGSDASIDNIPSGASITVDGVWRVDSDSSNRILIAKSSAYLTSGWGFRKNSNGNLEAWVECATTDAVSEITPTSVLLDSFADGKCHHLTFVYDDTGDKTLYIAVDGRWPSAYVTQTAGNGAYGGDAALSLYTGELNGSDQDYEGAHGWLHLNGARMYTPGTDFIPPTVLATDINTIEAWTCNQGTGNLTASVLSPNNDGVRTGTTWISAWDQQGTPVVPQSLEFFQENDGIDFGSGANIDNLFNADCTIEFIARLPENIPSNVHLFSKNNAGSTVGWRCYTNANGVVFRAIFANTDLIATDTFTKDSEYHHWALDWDVGTLTGRVFRDGVLQGSGTAIGAHQADAAEDCLVNARGVIGTGDGAFAIGPIRLSNVRRYTGNSFVPPPRTNISSVWTLPDANTQLQIEMTDGAGTTATDTSANAYHGTITFGTNTKWHNTCDLEVDEPGKLKLGRNGYNIGSDGANDGIHIYSEMIDASDYVIRPVVEYPNSSRGQARITIYDVIGGVALVQFDGPPLTGQHSGANNSPTMTDGGEVFPASLVGGTIYNITDGSSATITAVGGTNQDTITGVLAGGTDNDWDTNDVYMIKPPDNWVWAEPIALTTGVNADIMVESLNIAGEGVLTTHQIEVYDNLLQHGDHEAGAGNPYILTGWTNSGLDPGDTAAEAVTIHAGAQSIRWAAGAISEGMYDTPTIAQGAFFAAGFWSVGGGAVLQDIIMEAAGVGSAVLHSDPTVYQRTGEFTPSWSHNPAVWRAVTANPSMFLMADTGAINRYTDDVYAIVLDAITLTVTPRTYANSLETITGIQGLDIDGYDLCTQPVTRITATRGQFRFRVLFRHDPADWLDFGQATQYLVYHREDANNYIYCAITAADTIQLGYNAQGAGLVSGNWTPTGLASNVWYSMKVVYTAGYCRLVVDNVAVINLAGFAFAANPSVAVDWGNYYDNTIQLDGLLAPP